MLKILMMLYRFRFLENGNYEIGVHIADVSHYLQEGTILDDEAYKKSDFSVFGRSSSSNASRSII